MPPQPQPTPNAYRIHQWAAGIPPHVPAGAPSRPFVEQVSGTSSASPLSPRQPPSPRVRNQATPKLIKRTSATLPVPTLSVSSPAHVRPLPPTRSTHCAYSNGNTSNTTSEASTSLTSLLSEPLVATPEEGDCHFGISALVRSFVHRDRENANSTNETVIEQVNFTPSPSSKKTFPPHTKKSPVIQSTPPAHVRQKSPVKKISLFHDRGRSTPHSHTPTPVVFPSCRAAELDWDDDEDDNESFVSQVHYHHPHYQQKFEPQARAPSPSPSNSSTDSSVLLMAPKRLDGIRGRRGGRVIIA